MQPGQQQAGPGTDMVPNGAYEITGLEDFDESDLRLPRLVIDHENGGFADSLNPEFVMPSISVIALGLVKQRVMWPALMTDDEGDSNPMCKSVNHSTGYPNMTSSDKRELFPWEASGWNPNDFPRDEQARIVLPCNSCRFKEWKSHPDGKKTWCSEQHAIVLLYAPIDDNAEFQQEPAMLALFTAQRSSINASKAFFAGMFRQQKPAFAFRAKWSLRKEQRGKNIYYTPLMTIVGNTDQEQWPNYAKPYIEVRDFITQPPRLGDDQQQAGVTGSSIAQNNQMGNGGGGGFTNTTWAPGQPQQGTVMNQQGQPVQQYQSTPQPAPVQQQPAVDPAYLEWQRMQAATQAAQMQQQAASAQVATPVQPTAPVLDMGSPFPATPTPPAQAAPSAPTPGRDEEDPLPF